jgi:hypothetical protein
MDPSISPPLPQALPVPRPLRRRRAVLLLIAIVILAPFLLWGYSVLSTRTSWAAAEAEADLDLPRWRLMELEADRPDIADKDNSALHVIPIRRKAGRFSVGIAPNYEKIFEKLPPTAQLNQQQSDLLRGELAKIAKPLVEARTLTELSRGRYPITYTDDFISTLLPVHQDSREIVEWLQNDAMLLAHDKEFDKAFESCRAILNISRAFDGDLIVISHLIRLAEQSIAVTSLERVLAQGVASEERLQAMQALLDKDIRCEGWLQAVRGERAGMHQLFVNIRDGKIKAPALRGLLGGRKSGSIADSVTDWTIETFPSTMLKYYPDYLRHMNRCVDICKLPCHERLPKLKEWEDEVKNTKNPVIRLLSPAYSKVSHAECRLQAMLRSTMVALACERYRLKHKTNENPNAWPASLDVLVKEGQLDAIPADPFDGQPLRYRRTTDGIVVYSIGFDLIDNQGNIDRERNYLDPGLDIGFRLWNVDRRRQKALPPVAIPE